MKASIWKVGHTNPDVIGQAKERNFILYFPTKGAAHAYIEETVAKAAKFWHQQVIEPNTDPSAKTMSQKWKVKEKLDWRGKRPNSLGVLYKPAAGKIDRRWLEDHAVLWIANPIKISVNSKDQLCTLLCDDIQLPHFSWLHFSNWLGRWREKRSK